MALRWVTRGVRARPNSFQDQTHFNGEGPRPKDYSLAPQESKKVAKIVQNLAVGVLPATETLSDGRRKRETLERFDTDPNKALVRSYTFVKLSFLCINQASDSTCHMCPFSQLHVNKSLNKRQLLMSSQALSGRADHLNKADRDVSGPHAICWPLGDNNRRRKVCFSHIFSQHQSNYLRNSSSESAAGACTARLQGPHTGERKNNLNCKMTFGFFFAGSLRCSFNAKDLRPAVKCETFYSGK